MDADTISRSLNQLWENRPAAMMLLGLGFLIFVFLVVDTRRHKNRRKRPKKDWRP
jgi:hypothetical protein